MVVHPNTTNRELSLVALFAAWAMTDEILRRLDRDGYPELRVNDGVVIQHVLAGPLTISALAERMGMSQQAASKAVADLERRGLLHREPDPQDARARLLHLSDHGLRSVESARHHRRELEAELDAEFGAERIADSRALMAAIVGHLGGEAAVRGRRVRPPR
jgi:DNA-binding MarR family transcriptional regulator